MKYKYNYGRTARKDNNKNVIFLVLVIFIVVIISLFLFRENVVVAKINDVLLAPIKAFSNLEIGSSVSGFFTSKSKLEAENKQLKEENSEISLKLLEYEKLIKENESLRKMLDIKNAFKHYEMLLSRVIIRSHDNYTSTFIIDVGSKDGVKESMAVVHVNGLVGYISEVNEESSVVVTILDPKTSVSVVIPTISSPAILTRKYGNEITKYFKT